MKSEHRGPDEADAGEDAGADGDRPSSDEGARLSDWLVGRLRPSGIEGLAPPPPTAANPATSEPPEVPPEDGALVAPPGDAPLEATFAEGMGAGGADEGPLPIAGLPSRRRRGVLLAVLVGAIVIGLVAWRVVSSRPAPARAISERNDAPLLGAGDDLPRPPLAEVPGPPPEPASSAEAAASRQRGGSESVEPPVDRANPQGPSVGRFPDLPPHVLKTLEAPKDDEE